MMQSDTLSTEDLYFSEILAIRTKKALGDRQQTRLNENRVTFDNFGLARPKTRITTDFDRV